jgi:hypothetical protein
LIYRRKSPTEKSLGKYQRITVRLTINMTNTDGFLVEEDAAEGEDGDGDEIL